MHGVMGKPPGAATDKRDLATSKLMLLMLVAMTGVAPISLYLLVPALPVLAQTFGRDISIAQMTVSLYMVGIRSEEHTSELQSRPHLVCRLLLEKKKQKIKHNQSKKNKKKKNYKT